MILSLLRHVKNLSVRHYLVILVTVIVPVVFPTVMGYFEIGSLWVRIAVDVGVILVWLVFVVVVVSRLVQREAGEVARSVAERLDPLSNQVSQLEDESRNAVADIRQQMRDLEERTGEAVRDLGGNMRPKSLNLRATFAGAVGLSSVAVSVSGGSRWRRIRRWLRRAVRLAWEFVYGKRERS